MSDSAAFACRWSMAVGSHVGRKIRSGQSAVACSYGVVAPFGGDDGVSEPLAALARPRCASGRPRSRSHRTPADRPALA